MPVSLFFRCLPRPCEHLQDRRPPELTDAFGGDIRHGTPEFTREVFRRNNPVGLVELNQRLIP